MKRRFVLSAGVLAFFSSLISAGRTAVPTSNVPARLIPRGWEVTDEITGDLNRDGQSDLIFQLARKDESEILDKSSDPYLPRRLVVAFRERGGYRQVVTDERVLSTAAQGKAAAVESTLRVERGSLVIWSHKDPGSTKWATTNRFRWIEDRFQQVGWTAEGAGNLGNDDYWHHRVLDVNLLTGIIEESRGKWHEDERRQPQGYPKKLRYPLTPIVLIPAVPTSLSAPLSPRTIRLGARPEAPSGRERRQNSTGLSATLSMALVGEGLQRKLYVRAWARGGGKLNASEVRLVNAEGTPIRPDHVERAAMPGGYAWQASYQPSSLKVCYGQLTIDEPYPRKVPGWGVWDPGYGMLREFFRGSLEVISPTPSEGEPLVLSTAPGGKQPGLFWLTTPELPRLGMKDNLQFLYHPSDI